MTTNDLGFPRVPLTPGHWKKNSLRLSVVVGPASNRMFVQCLLSFCQFISAFSCFRWAPLSLSLSLSTEYLYILSRSLLRVSIVVVMSLLNLMNIHQFTTIFDQISISLVRLCVLSCISNYLETMSYNGSLEPLIFCLHTAVYTRQISRFKYFFLLPVYCGLDNLIVFFLPFSNFFPSMPEFILSLKVTDWSIILICAC